MQLENLADRRHDRGHRAVVAEGDPAHLAAARGGRLERVGEREDLGRDERAVLAERVAHHHVGLDAVLGEQSAHGRVHREDGRLRDRRLLEVLLGLLHGLGVLPVHEDVARELAAEDRLEDAVGLLEDGGHEGVVGREVAAHVHVLAALAGEEERDLPGPSLRGRGRRPAPGTRCHVAGASVARPFCAFCRRSTSSPASS